jgi:hypothetical protein
MRLISWIYPPNDFGRLPDLEYRLALGKAIFVQLGPPGREVYCRVTDLYIEV